MMGSKKGEKASEKTTKKLACSRRLPFLLTAFSLSHTYSKKTKTKRNFHRAANAVRAAREKERLAARKARATES